MRIAVIGAGAMGSVGATDNTGAIVSGGSTSITISGGTIGVSGVSVSVSIIISIRRIFHDFII